MYRVFVSVGMNEVLKILVRFHIDAILIGFSFDNPPTIQPFTFAAICCFHRSSKRLEPKNVCC